MPNLHKSYKEQNGCHNCEHAFEFYDYDQGPEYFCNINAPPRPPCMSVAMDTRSVRRGGEPEHFFNMDWYKNRKYPDAKVDARMDTMFHEWDEWAVKQRVKSWGICKQWSKKHDEQT